MLNVPKSKVFIRVGWGGGGEGEKGGGLGLLFLNFLDPLLARVFSTSQNDERPLAQKPL